MTINDERARVLAGELPGGLKRESARDRLLTIMTMLRRLTDADHLLSIADLQKVWRAYFGLDKVPSENTLREDVQALCENNVLGCSFSITPNGSACTARDLTPRQVGLLCNMLSETPLLSQLEASEVQEALLNLVSCHQEEALDGRVVVAACQQSNPTGFLQALDDVAKAVDRTISQGKKVEFVDAAGTSRVETPIALEFFEGRYYLETYVIDDATGAGCLSRSRIDQLSKVKVSRRKADSNDEVAQARSTAKRRLRASFDPLVANAPRLLFLRVADHAREVFAERFGEGSCRTAEGACAAGSAARIFCVEVAPCDAFFQWMVGTRGGIALQAPRAIDLTLKSGEWASMMQGVTIDQLQEAYWATMSEYRDFITDAMQPYEWAAGRAFNPQHENAIPLAGADVPAAPEADVRQSQEGGRTVVPAPCPRAGEAS